MTDPMHPAGDGWSGWLRDVTITVPEPDSAIEYWAALLGGRAGDGAVELGSDTEIHVEDGEPGFAAGGLELAPGAREGLDGTDVIVDPDGRRFELREAPDQLERPASPTPRLGHLTFQSPDPVGVQGWWERLDFKLSEGLGDFFRWLRCNPVHHTVAFSRADTARLHHVGIEVPDRAALVAACDRLAEHGHRIEYGPGRHYVGNNIFAYFLDRHGLRFEIFCELEWVTDPQRSGPVHGRELPRELSVNTWGPQPPESFLTGT